jgi:hypothetical protein
MNKLLIIALLSLCAASSYAEDKVLYKICHYQTNDTVKCYQSASVPEIRGAFIKFITDKNKIMILSSNIVIEQQ